VVKIERDPAETGSHPRQKELIDMIDQTPASVKKLAESITILTAEELGLQWKFPTTDGSLSQEVFRIEVIGDKPKPDDTQTVVLYRVGVAGSAYRRAPMYAEWQVEPTPVAILKLQFCKSTRDLLEIPGLLPYVEAALRGKADEEIKLAQARIDKLTIDKEA